MSHEAARYRRSNNPQPWRAFQTALPADRETTFEGSHFRRACLQIEGCNPMSNEDHDELRDKLDAFSRRLDARTREFKERGEFSDMHEPFLESIRKRQASIKKKLDSAIQHGAKRDLIKYEAERDFNGLIEEVLRWEKQLDADSMKREGEC
jgi:hypothetical protein